MARRDVLQILYNNFMASIRRQPPPAPVGQDHLGNKYFEFKPADNISCRRTKRLVQPVDESIDYDLPFEWEAWLRGKRDDPPTADEIQERMARQAEAVANAKRVDQVTANKPELKVKQEFPKFEGYSSQASGPVVRKKDCIDE